MSNAFVDYLNTMNNASSGNVNSIAEAQVINDQFDSIRVERKIGKYIASNIKLKNQVFVLTGHAGDGKTSILIQVLKELDLLGKGNGLKISDTVCKNNIKLFYVKDMSELTAQKQVEMLQRAMEAPRNGMSSIIISNTGPLISSIKRLYGKGDDIIRDEIENKLLEQLDKNADKEIELSGNKFFLINIARIDNTNFASEILQKIKGRELWIDCCNCNKNENCPIYYNYKLLDKYYYRISKFVEAYYRWLFENDKRITIRQMMSQITFAITGNLKCQNIKEDRLNKFSRFIYNFANLFFGYQGINDITSAKQIKAIAILQELKLEATALKEDYDMFVKEDFSRLPTEINDLITQVWVEFSKKYDEIYENEKNDKYGNLSKEIKLRQAIRRFYLMYSSYDSDEDIEEVLKEVYGETFIQYKSFITNKKQKRDLRLLMNRIFEALFIKNVGVPPINKSTLYLTLTRYDRGFQNVLLLLGEVKEDEIEVKQKKIQCDYEDFQEKYELYLDINSGNEKFKLSLALLEYFSNIVNGAITTEVNAALSHGLAELDSKLLKEFRYKNNDEKMTLIINTMSNVEKVSVIFEDSNQISIN